MSEPYARVAGPTKITADGTSKTLATLGLALNKATKGLSLIVPTTGIYFNYGTATSSSAPFMVGVVTTIASRSDLLTLEVITGGGNIDFFVEEIGQ